MADTQELLGQQIGEYSLQRQLGRGTFGVVYQAEHIHDQSLVAIKLLRLQLTRSLELKDFLNEARVIRLRHPHIIPILDFGISPEDVPFIVMEYAAGGSIRDRFWHGASLPLPEIVAYTTQLADALQFAHTRRLIHRDIKPENMLLRADGTVLLCDFGIAKIMEQSSTMSVHAQAGTPAYMAPEQGLGAPCPASDQYALAVVVYEWLTGRRPFLGTPLEVAVQHRLNPPPPLCILRPGLPPEAEEVVLKALAKKPEDRFETIEQFAEALVIAIDDSPTEKVPVFSPAGRQTTFSERATNALSRPYRSSPRSQRRVEKEVSEPVVGEPVENDHSTPVSQIQIRRWIIPKRRQIFPALLTFLILVACVLSYFAFFVPPPTSISIHPQNVQSPYDRAVATVGTMFGSNAQHTGNNPYEQILSTSTVDKLALKWNVPTGSLLEASPVIANGLIYLGSHAGLMSQLSARAVADGHQKWSISVPGSITRSTPAVTNGLIYLGSTDGHLYAFDALSGAKRWSADTRGSIESAPTIAHGLVYIGNESGKLTAFDALTGTQKWVDSTNNTDAITTAPAIADGLVYISTSNSQLYAFDALSGRLQWATNPLGNEFSFSSPAIANGLIYLSLQDTITSSSNKLYAFGALDGVKHWESESFNVTLSSPAIANNIVYVVSQDGQLFTLDALTGKTEWHKTIGNAGKSAPVLANGLVYTGSGDGKISVFDALSGAPMWDQTVDGSIASSPTIANGVLYVSSSAGQLYAFSPH